MKKELISIWKVLPCVTYGNTIKARILCWNGHTYYGVAKWDGTGTFDREFGEQLAIARARDKVFQSNVKIYNHNYAEEEKRHAAELEKLRKERKKILEFGVDTDFIYSQLATKQGEANK